MSTRTVTNSMVTHDKYRAQQAESTGNPASTPDDPDGSGSPNPTEGLGRTPGSMKESVITSDCDGSTQHKVVLVHAGSTSSALSTIPGSVTPGHNSERSPSYEEEVHMGSHDASEWVAAGPVAPDILRRRPGAHTVYSQNPSRKNAEHIFVIRQALTELKSDKDSKEAVPMGGDHEVPPEDSSGGFPPGTPGKPPNRNPNIPGSNNRRGPLGGNPGGPPGGLLGRGPPGGGLPGGGDPHGALGNARPAGAAQDWLNQEVEQLACACWEWTFEDLVCKMYKQFINGVTTQCAAAKFDATEYSCKQEVNAYLNKLVRRAAHMVQHPDDYSFKWQFIDGLPDDIRQDILKIHGITAEHSTLEDIIEAARKVENDNQYALAKRKEKSRSNSSTGKVNSSPNKAPGTDKNPRVFRLFKRAGNYATEAIWSTKGLGMDPRLPTAGCLE
ncbi:hypothetical protein HYDPIDRAFT_171170 [Hydnomerulius pinastri MD-312]|uniref:Uncharacterized protein n=1 Tax=Hydnomerulius pinastri MD-312 TaxID=994086 RepID=A0A0C9VM60_9AGAM|nr:hypothetical protein HYDPIDRAFT_171170 [Hydnomerulius pinastri MD-312]